MKKIKRSVIIPKKEFIPSLGIVGIGVIPSCQGKGYGSMLLQAVERLAVEEGFSRVGLSVRTSNEQAIKSYLRNGFVVTGTRGDELSMEKRINYENTLPRE